MRKILLAVLLLLLPACADAQLYLPQGVGLPPQSVIGNPLTQTGDAVAVTFSQLRASVGIPAQSCGPSLWVSSISQTSILGCTQPSIADISGLGAGIATWLATPTSANLAAAMTDETGSGAAVFATSPTLVTPTLGVATATSVNKVAITAPATSATLTVANTKTFTVNNTLTLSGTDGSTLNVGAGGTLAAVATSGSASDLGTGTLPTARLNLGQITASLGADVNLTVSSTYVDGPSIAQGSTGTWWASGSVVVLDTTAQATFSCKLWDGTTIIDSGNATTQGAGLTYTMSLSGFLATPAANLRISCADTNGTANGRIKFNVTGTGKDSTISAFRIN